MSPRQRAHKTFHLLFEHVKTPDHILTEEAREWDYGMSSTYHYEIIYSTDHRGIRRPFVSRDQGEERGLEYLARRVGPKASIFVSKSEISSHVAAQEVKVLTTWNVASIPS